MNPTQVIQANDTLIVTFGGHHTKEQADHLQAELQANLPCKVIILTGDVNLAISRSKDNA